MSLPFSINPALKDLPVYQPGRPIEEVARQLNLPAASIIKVASNENPLGPSRKAVAAMRAAFRHANLYPDGNAFYLKQALAKKLGVTPANLIIGNGSNEIIEFLGHALLSSEAEVVVSQFCFAVYPIVTQLFGARLVVVPAKNYAHDLEAMLAAVTSKTRIVFVANPNNPTGTIVSRPALEDFIAALPERVVLALDEAYIEFLADAPDFLPLVRGGAKPNVLLFRTFSKIYGLAGLRVGYGIGHESFIRELEKIRQPFNINSLAQAGALAALDDEAHVARTRRTTSRGLKFFARAFRQWDLPYVPSHANFILARVGEGQRVFNAMQKSGVIVRPMDGYQMPEWLRISIGTTKENQRALDALGEALGRK